MSSLDRWWEGISAERYWLEVSARGTDLGADLNAPVANESGERFWSYELLREVRDGDIVVHYDRDARSVVAWSEAVGLAWPDTVTWAARGTVARSKNIQPHERPGLRVSLNGPYRCATPVTLEQIRAAQAQLIEIRGEKSYFPFELGGRVTRPMQGYLFKLPLAFIELFAELQDVPRFGNGAVTPQGTTTAAVSSPPRPAFVPKNEDVRSKEAQPWTRDPSEVDRALSAHARVERLVAEAAEAEGWVARAYRPGDPVFDLLLERVDGSPPIVVVEVKSTTGTNEEKQLRLALGQVLRYRQLLRTEEPDAAAFIAIEMQPRDSTWSGLCADVGVELVWPSTVAAALRAI